MECPLCGHAKAYKHGKMPNGHQRYLCPACNQTFLENFDSLYYRRHVSPEQIRQVLQTHSEGSCLPSITLAHPRDAQRDTKCNAGLLSMSGSE
ncbi:IS1 family transposase [Leptolyngbya sp. FACHB-1624]|uniref:IS1 family transposase n=1 Tax=Leptolyngbya TaxID=47251 RepID=UPI001688350C|nr:IS1 family transposase [Leptolyngbya sp. FACHB-1624]MBN8564997.1 IS1 family transposase [Leptolyngbya sp. UWPOB_LEPTO1]